MEPTYFAQYRGFEFHCSPQRLGDRAFVPRLVVSNGDEKLSLEIPIVMPDRPPFEDPTSAAHLAFAYGRRWVDNGYDAAAAQAAMGDGEGVPDPTIIDAPPTLPR